MPGGLRRKPHYEEVLNAAIKDVNSQHGILSVPMQRAAQTAINSPLFQRVQATLTEDLADQQRHVLEQRGFENSVQRLSVDARVSHEDLKWLVENLGGGQPPPPPMPPPPAANPLPSPQGTLWAPFTTAHMDPSAKEATTMNFMILT